MKPLRICFVGPKCYDLLAGTPAPRHFGGAERQQVFLARGLVRRGFDVSFVTLDYGQPDGIDHDDIHVYKAYAVDAGWPGVRFVSPRWRGLAAAMRRADADVYYQMGADSETGQVGAWCRWRGRRFVFATASDSDCDPGLPLLSRRRQRVLYLHGLRRANKVIVQTSAQEALLRRSFGIDATVIRNCTPDPGCDPAIVEARRQSAAAQVLWVGRLVPVKRLEVLLDVAAACPDLQFHVVGSGNPASPYVRGLHERAAALPNVVAHGGISDAALNELYARAALLLCTSSHEGVPTTFLEAWARGLPVVTTVDPDGAIAAHGLGDVAATPADLPARVRHMIARSDYTAIAGRVRRHFLTTHTVDAFVRAHEELFRSLEGDVAPGKAAPSWV